MQGTKAYEGVEKYLHAFLKSVLYRAEQLAWRFGRFPSLEDLPFTQWIGSWFYFKAALQAFEKRVNILISSNLNIPSSCCFLSNYSSAFKNKRHRRPTWAQTPFFLTQ